MRKINAFTLAEVLITLVVIGVVAAFAISALLQSTMNTEYKVGYKKAYSDVSRGVLASIAFGDFPERTEKFDFDITNEEWNILKKQFGIAKLCENNNAYDCWVDSERLCIGCGSSSNQGVPGAHTKVFIDLSGRSWALYSTNENIYIVDVNGDKKPNQVGKDRWIFTFADKNGKRICAGEPCSNPDVPAQVIPLLGDVKSKDSYFCPHPPCYFKSWLIN